MKLLNDPTAPPLPTPLQKADTAVVRAEMSKGQRPCNRCKGFMTQITTKKWACECGAIHREKK